MPNTAAQGEQYTAYFIEPMPPVLQLNRSVLVKVQYLGLGYVKDIVAHRGPYVCITIKFFGIADYEAYPEDDQIREFWMLGRQMVMSAAEDERQDMAFIGNPGFRVSMLA
ncbi:hypothetical protein ONZ45_g13833 [Pleurotus djamor]|nr:hypothetical protein ONZ45_g13833 [Pleurotus djamor]